MLKLGLLSILSLSTAAHAASVAHWDTKKLVTIPASFPAAGHVGQGIAELRIEAVGGDHLVCSYVNHRGVFQLRGCRGSREEHSCRGAFSEWIGHEPFSRGAAGDQAIADKVTLKLPACARGAICKDLGVVDALGTTPGEACEATGTSNVHLLGDLECGTSGFAFRFHAKGKRFEGLGHAIKAPRAAVGLFVTGSRLLVSRVKANDVANGTGLQAYNATRLVVQDSEFRRNVTGLNVYSDAVSPKDVVILRNNLSDNSWVGLRFNTDGDFGAVNPYIRGNDLSRSGYYALWLDVKSVYLFGPFGNRFDGSTNGIYFLKGDAIVALLDLSRAKIKSTELFFNHNRNVMLLSSNLNYGVEGTAMQDRIGVHLYGVKNAVLDGVSVASADVGVKIATDGGVSGNVMIVRSRLTGEAVASVMVQSYDGTDIGRLDIEQNDFRDSAKGVWFVGTTNASSAAIQSNLE